MQKALAQGWQREAALLEPQLQYLQAQLTACNQQVCTARLSICAAAALTACVAAAATIHTTEGTSAHLLSVCSHTLGIGMSSFCKLQEPDSCVVAHTCHISAHLAANIVLLHAQTLRKVSCTS